MFLEGVGEHDVFQRAALLRDLQLAVAVGTLEGDVQVGEQRVLLRIGEAQFLREDQRAAGQQCLADPAQQAEALVGGDELQGEVHCHQRGGLQVQGENVGLDQLDRQQLLVHGVLGMQVFTAALDHRVRVVHPDHPAAVVADVAS